MFAEHTNKQLTLQIPTHFLNKGAATDITKRAENLIADFKTWIEQHKNEITALQIFYSQPFRRRELTYKNDSGSDGEIEIG